MIAVKNLHLVAGSFEIKDISFALEVGEYAVLMGKTGSGKITILEAISGLKPIVSGSIKLLDREVAHLKAAERGVGYVPQDRALFHSMTVRHHLAFALQLRHWKRNDIARRVDELANLLGIEKLLHRKPFGLSGGESQRVALGRALSFYPRILLLDEPLSALDEETKDEICLLLKKIQLETHVTILHVTHSMSEAQRLADHLFLLKDGKLHAASAEESEKDGEETEFRFRPNGTSQLPSDDHRYQRTNAPKATS